MEAVAKLKNVPTSPRKMRLVADMIRGVRVEKALGILKFEPKHNSIYLEKLLLSAISNWESKNEDSSVEDASLIIKSIHVDGGRMLKRLRPAPQGRAHRIRKRSNHVTLVVDSASSEKTEIKEVAKVEKKETPKKAAPKKEAKPKAEAAKKKAASKAKKETASKESKTVKKTDK